MKMLHWLWGLGIAAALAAAPALPVSAGEPPAKKKKDAPARKGTGIAWHVEPAGVEIYLDGKKIGVAGELEWTASTPGRHTVRLVNGGDETEMDVGLKKGQTLKFTFVFDES